MNHTAAEKAARERNSRKYAMDWLQRRRKEFVKIEHHYRLNEGEDFDTTLLDEASMLAAYRADIIETCGRTSDEPLQRALGKLSQAMGNPAIEFKGGEIEIALIEFAVKRLEEFQERACGQDDFRHAVTCLAEAKVRYKNELKDVNGYACTACEEVFVSVGLPNYCPECGEEIKGEVDA